MKKSLLALLLASLVTLNSVTFAGATVKAGAACPKAGKTSTVGSRVYTCIKLGSKHYWNNGTLVKSSTPTQTKSPLSGSVSQQNAIRKAESYLRSSAFSRSGLIGQLEFSGFSTADATFAVDALGTNWSSQASKKAESYLRSSAFSRSGLIGQLEFSGFSTAEATFGTDAQKANWSNQASKKAESYLRSSAFSRSGLISQLEFSGFSTAEAIFGTDSLKTDWNEQAAKKAASYLRSSAFSRVGLIAQLEFSGFTKAEAEYGVTKAGL
jgi:hypothetical protein